MKSPCRFCIGREKCRDALGLINVCCDFFSLDPDLENESRLEYEEYEKRQIEI